MRLARAINRALGERKLRIQPFAWIVALWLVASLLLPAWANSDVMFTFTFVPPGLTMVMLLVFATCWLSVPTAAAVLARRRLKEGNWAPYQ
jgi:hypothetical protein